MHMKIKALLIAPGSQGWGRQEDLWGSAILARELQVQWQVLLDKVGGWWDGSVYKGVCHQLGSHELTL